MCAPQTVTLHMFDWLSFSKKKNLKSRKVLQDYYIRIKNLNFSLKIWLWPVKKIAKILIQPAHLTAKQALKES